MAKTRRRFRPEFKLEAAQLIVDPRSQFASEEFTGVLMLHGVKVSMDGKDRWVNNILAERLWCSSNMKSSTSMLMKT